MHCWICELSLVGNKCDKEVGGGRTVPRREGEALAKKLGTLFIETSAKTTTGVQDAFVEVVRKVCALTTFLKCMMISLI